MKKNALLFLLIVIVNASFGQTPGNDYIQNQTATAQAASFNISGNGYVGGNVGVGTATPTYKLHVNGTAGFNGNLVVIGATYLGNVLNFKNGDYDTRLVADDGYGSAILEAPRSLVFRTTATNTRLLFGVNNPSINGYALTIGTDNKVGIGTTSPAFTLDVNGTFKAGNQNQTNAINGRTYFTNTNSYGDYIATFGNGTDTKSRLSVQELANNSYYSNLGTINGYAFGTGAFSSSGNIGTYFGGSYVASFLFDAQAAATNSRGVVLFDNLNGAIQTWSKNGNVGIGITNPQAKLAVNGDIFARKIKVTQSGWADYVFEPSYQLPTLQEVEAFIKQHKHLPGVPSAKEVYKEGLDVGENQAVLLKKIEELTLYMIELKKQVDVQQEKIKQQNKSLQEQQRQLNKLNGNTEILHNY